MRKRKLYVSEFLKRATFKEYCQVQISRFGIPLEFESFTKAQNFIEIYEKKEHITCEIETWNYDENLGYIIKLK